MKEKWEVFPIKLSVLGHKALYEDKQIQAALRNLHFSTPIT
jgi:hypothetical protein